MSDFETASIKRAPRNKEHPYLMVSKALIRDKTLSPECRWLVTFLLCNVDHWEISTKQVLEEVKEYMGLEKLRELFKQISEAGYIKRESYLDNGLKRYRYLLSETAEFNKCLPYTEKPCTANPGTENPRPLKKNIEKDNYQERTTTSPSPSKNGIAVGLLEEFGRTLKEPGQAERAVKYYLENEEELKKKAHTNPKGLCIHLVRKGVDLEKAGSKDIVQKRKAWAEKHAWAGGTGALTACKDGVEVISGSIARFIKYVSNDPFWESKGLSLNLAI